MSYVTGSMKTLHACMQILTYFGIFKSHNFYTTGCNIVQNIYFGTKNMDYQDFTSVFVKVCKIHERGGFLQSQSHNLLICTNYVLNIIKIISQ